MKKCLLLSGVILPFILGCASKQQIHSEPLNQKASLEYSMAYDSFTQSDLVLALTHALQSEKLAPANPEIHNLLGLIYFRQQNFSSAENEFKKSIELDYRVSEAYNNLGSLYFETKRYDDALKILQKGLENPLYLHSERIYNNIGLAQRALNQDEAAIRSFEESIRLKNNFYLPYQNLGKLFFDLKKYSSAKPYLERAATLCKDCSEPRYYLGSALMQEKQMSEALKYFKEGADVDPLGFFGQLCKESIVAVK